MGETTDIILFTITHSLIIFGLIYGIAGLWAYFVFVRHKTAAATVFLILFGAYGLLSGAASGALIGLCLAAIYRTGQFAMPTWVPLAFSLLQVTACVGRGEKTRCLKLPCALSPP